MNRSTLRRFSIVACVTCAASLACGAFTRAERAERAERADRADRAERAGPVATPPALTALIEQERAFAKAASDKGTRDAFLEFLADESLLFRPGPTPGKLFYKNSPALPTRLSWAPDFADVSSAGDLGYTSGPYEVSKSATDPPLAYGHFTSLWRIQKDGSWKVEVDIGISHEKPSMSVADVKTVETPKDKTPAPRDAKPMPDWQNELVTLDTALATRSEAVGLAKAFEEASADSIRVYENDHQPAIGKAAAMKLIAASGVATWKPALARVSTSGDLGYTTGGLRMAGTAPPPGPPPAGAQPLRQTPPAGQTSSAAASTPQSPAASGARSSAPTLPHFYLRIWRRDNTGRWKIVLDLTT